MTAVQESQKLLDVARGLAPMIAAAGAEIERERRIPEPIVRALCDAGLFRLLVPASLGGPEADLLTFAQVIEEVAKADGSAAWCVAQAAGSTLVASCMQPGAASEIFGDPTTILSWGPGLGVAVRSDGGNRLTGQWSFASGSHHATWLGGIAKVVDRDGKPWLCQDGSPGFLRLLFPASEAKFTDVWRVSGLRGTGSDNYAVEDLFIPETRTFGCGPSGRPLLELRKEPGPLYAFPLVCIYSIGFASVALGIARAAIDGFVELASAKTPALLSRALRDDAVVQFQVAHAEADLRSARSFLFDTIRAAWETAEAVDPISLEHRVNIRLATTYAMHKAADVVDAVYRAAGATAIFESQPFERRLRDVLAVTQQIQGRQTHFTTVGQYLLGLDPDPTSI